MLAGTQCQRKMRLGLFLAPADLIYMVNTSSSSDAVVRFIGKCSVGMCGNAACIFSAVASECPTAHEENPPNRESLRRFDGTGAGHQGRLPHVRHQPHPVRQLPPRSHAGERGAVSRVGATFCDLPEGAKDEQMLHLFIAEEQTAPALTVSLSPFLKHGAFYTQTMQMSKVLAPEPPMQEGGCPVH